MKKITHTISRGTIVQVRFLYGGKAYFFGSLAAIFELFTPTQVGCSLESLWQKGLFDDGRPVVTTTCVISKHTLFRKANTKPRTNKKQQL